VTIIQVIPISQERGGRKFKKQVNALSSSTGGRISLGPSRQGKKIMSGGQVKPVKGKWGGEK